jgi:hypothetical protein
MGESASGGRAVRVMIDGLFRGQELQGEGELVLEGHTIILVTERAHVMLPLAEVEGVVHQADTLELHAVGGDVLRVSGDETATVARELARRALVVPELTRSLRALGSPRAMPGPEHDRFFSPFLDARRAAERATTPESMQAALDARTLRAALSARLRECAAERYPSEPPERRALEAELFEYAADVLVSLGTLERTQEALRACGARERFARWRDWSTALHAVFASADACWPTLGAVLVAERREPASRGWRRPAWLGGRSASGEREQGGGAGR